MAKRLFLMVAFIMSNILLSATFLNSTARAKDYAYQGKIEGMVCAFCAYNVSKNISQLSGIDVASVNVDLKSGRVNFLSSSPVEAATVSRVFADSGFALIEFFKIVNSDLNSISFSSDPLLGLNFSSSQLESLAPILDAIGSLAASQTSLLSIKAPQSDEFEILKSILAGRQKVIKVLFVAVESKLIKVELFPQAVDKKNQDK